MENTDLKEKICSLKDEELIILLQQRNGYRKEAIEIAIQEAQNRKIIDSEEDLKTQRFQPVPKPPRSFFPHLSTENQVTKIFTSLIRILYLIAIIPIFFGALKIIESQILDGIFLISSAALWIGISVLLQKKPSIQLPFILAIIFSIVVAFTFYRESFSIYFKLSDWIVVSIAISLVLYILGYLYVLQNRRNKSR